MQPTKQFPQISWFPGLNALRSIAALLVVTMHTHLGLKQSGLPMLPEWPILLKGLSAVSFFFVLSGFLITFLLLKEWDKTATINVRQFYLRRVFRIWPLYFFVVAAGLLFYWQIVPMLGLDFAIEYPKGLAVALYAFFAANLMNSLFHVGGMLHVTWSIAVEEQFYLFWAPMVRRWKNHLPGIIAGVILVFYALSVLNTLNTFGLSSGLQQFISTLQFHFMGIGAGAAWLLYYRQASLLNLMVFKHRVLRWLLTGLILTFYFGIHKSLWSELLLPLPLGLLYAWLILNVSVNPAQTINLENRFSHFLGSISYGIYMLHMPVVYALSFAATKLPSFFRDGPMFLPLFYAGTILLTICLAGLSHQMLEKPLLEQGRRWMTGTPGRLNNSLKTNPF